MYTLKYSIREITTPSFLGKTRQEKEKIFVSNCYRWNIIQSTTKNAFRRLAFPFFVWLFSFDFGPVHQQLSDMFSSWAFFFLFDFLPLLFNFSFHVFSTLFESSPDATTSAYVYEHLKLTLTLALETTAWRVWKSDAINSSFSHLLQLIFPTVPHQLKHDITGQNLIRV